MTVARIHGGPGVEGPARFDFSTTANACGPCPLALAALREANPCHYPDPAYTVLRRQLAQLHGVDAGRVVLAASASEFIFRITAVSGGGSVSVPVHAFGDYRTAAQGWGRPVGHDPLGASLAWFTDPGSPQGLATPLPGGLWPDPHAQRWGVLDRACEPLRLEGCSAWAGAALDAVFQLWSPNKALGLTGVRAAYAIAPVNAQPWVDRLEATCPSWPLGAAGVALLSAWASPAVQQWVADTRHTLRQWKQLQREGFERLGWTVEPSLTNFSLVRAPQVAGQKVGHQPSHGPALGLGSSVLAGALAAGGVAWRDTTSFGLPGAWRVSVQSPAAQEHLWAVLQGLG